MVNMREEIIEETVRDIEERWDVPTVEASEDQDTCGTYAGVLSFSTERANYHLYGGIHSNETQTSEVIPEMDALVLEKGSYKDEYGSLEALDDHRQYKEVVGTNIDTVRSPIYYVDTESKYEIADLDYDTDGLKKALREIGVAQPISLGSIGIPAFAALKLAPTYPEAAVLALPVAATGSGWVANKTENTYIDDIAGHLQLSGAYTPFGGRSALSAEKIEEFVAPKVGEETGEKPDIYVEYGAGHLDIKPYLQRPRLRRSVMAAHDVIGYFPNNGPYRDIVAEMRFDKFTDDPINTYFRGFRGKGKVEYQKTFYEIEDISSGYKPVKFLKKSLKQFLSLENDSEPAELIGGDTTDTDTDLEDVNIDTVHED